MKPMTSNKFKLTLITAAILSSGTASAALYQVVEVDPGTTYDYQSSFGVAIEPGVATDAVNEDLGCFDDAASNCNADNFTLAGETRLSNTSAGEAVDGLSYREEAPFGMDNRFLYIQDRDDFENYCDNELRFATCESWASVRWTQWANELSNDVTPNSIGFTGTTSGTPLDETKNIVINSLTSDETPQAVGIASTTGDVTEYRRNSVTGFVGGTEYSDGLQARVWKTDGTYTVGSIATSATNDEGTYYSSKAAVWDGTTAVQLNWGERVDGPEVDNYLAQGSLRDFVVSGSTLYAVGYNTYDVDSNDNLLNATVFSVDTANVSDAASWSSSSVSGATVRENNLRSGDYIYSNTLLTGVNSNLVAIGESKRSVTGDNGSTGSRVFVVDDVTSPSASYLSGDIFFNGAGGKAGGINSYNEIVGQVDAENVREANGKPRRKRAFIYPYNGTGTVDERRALFNNQGWWLDNLTNGGTYSSNNNQYRIIDAADINDAGVIAATAVKCQGGYSTTAHNASCSGEETTVAVKLMPIPGATSDNISTRGTDDMSTERSGGSLGLWVLAVLGFIGFRRK